MGDSRIGGVFRAKGVLSAEVQRLVRMHCERGNAQTMIEAVADYLLTDGMARGRIPQNAGLKTKDLLDRTEHAMMLEVESYHMAGGILTAKGYCSLTGLVAEMAKQWLKSFAAPIPTETNIKGTLSDPEVVDRLTVVALKLRKLIAETSDTHDPSGVWESGTISFDEEKLEGLCTRAATLMFKTFNEPNESIHEILHGKKT